MLNSLGIATTLLLEVEAGPSLAGRTGELTVADKSGQVFATQSLTGRKQLNIPLPPDRLKNLELRLHITNGGTPIPTDPRILNFRVFRAEFSMEDEHKTQP